MSRGLTTAQKAVVESAVFPLAFFAEFDFTIGPVRLWTGLGDITVDAKEWSGVGSLGQVGDATESSSAKATTVVCALSGVPNEIVSAILTGVNRGRVASLWWAAMNSTFTAPVDGLVSYWVGRIGSIERTDDGAANTVRVPIEGLYVDVKTPRLRRWSQGAQDQRYPGDTGLRYVPAIANRILYFGTQEPH